MKNAFITLAVVFAVALSGCQAKETSKIAANTPIKSENEAENNCLISEVPVGEWCYTHQADFSILLPSDFETYGPEGAGNFVAPDKNNFIHIGYFPLTAFSEEAQVLLKTSKIEDYLQYEQDNICSPNPNCTSRLIKESFKNLKLSKHGYFKYEIEATRDNTPFKSVHYAILINDHFLDFSSSDGEMVPNPPNSENLVESKYVEEQTFEDILESLTYKD